MNARQMCFSHANRIGVGYSFRQELYSTVRTPWTFWKWVASVWIVDNFACYAPCLERCLTNIEAFFLFGNPALKFCEDEPKLDSIFFFRTHLIQDTANIMRVVSFRLIICTLLTQNCRYAAHESLLKWKLLSQLVRPYVIEFHDNCTYHWTLHASLLV